MATAYGRGEVLHQNETSKITFKSVVPLLGTVILSILMTFQNCSEVQFSESLPSNVIDLGNGEKLATQGFSAQPTLRPVDLVWVVDNSGSMSEEATHVRNNITNFMNSISGRSDVKVAIIGREGDSGTSVNLAETLRAQGHRLIDYTVSSTNSLVLLNRFLCSSSEPANIANGVCDNNFINGKNGENLTSFFRPQSKKVFVFVTDDESSISYQDFTEVFTAILPGQTPLVHGFVGLGNAQSPCQARTGLEYQDLASITGGEIFNICDADWSGHFAKLSENIISISSNRFPLAYGNVKEIRSVSINGSLIDPSYYSLDDSYIVIDPSQLQDNSGQIHQVVVEYVFVDQKKADEVKKLANR